MTGISPNWPQAPPEQTCELLFNPPLLLSAALRGLGVSALKAFRPPEISVNSCQFVSTGGLRRPSVSSASSCSEIRQVFSQSGRDRISSQQLAAALSGLYA